MTLFKKPEGGPPTYPSLVRRGTPPSFSCMIIRDSSREVNPLWVNFEKNHRGFFVGLQMENGFPGTSGKNG